MELAADSPLASAVVAAIQGGHADDLRQLLIGNPDLATSVIVDSKGVQRSLLHIVADWPGHFPNAAATVAMLIEAGADVHARVHVPGRADMAETPLHWAASSDDVAVIDALLDGGADIEISGAIFTGGAPMSDAVVFAQWNAARRLLERGARTTIWQSAALGLTDRVRTSLATDPSLSHRDITNAFWNACRGGHRDTAEFLLDQGADMHWIGHDNKTPLQIAQESAPEEFVQWLRGRNARVERHRPGG